MLKKKTALRWPIAVLISIVVFGIIAFFFYQIGKIDKPELTQTDLNIEAPGETTSIIEDVGALMELPKDEIPTIATISDIEKLANQPFFDTAENGDIFLAYTVAMKAILYRPSINKIINAAPLSVTQPEITKAMSIAYENGTSTVGLSVVTEGIVKEKYPDSETISLSNAVNSDHTKTLVIDISGTHEKEAFDLAKLLNGEVTSLPEEETAPEADILIIVGK
mgnify:CR=1 FL=1